MDQTHPVRPATLGRYRLDARIGEGAMAEVFRAHDTGIDRTVAIKVLKPDYRRDPEFGRRFLQEARAAGVLSHANIATIYDVGEEKAAGGGVPYIAMELVDGRPLDEVLRAGGRMTPERVLALAIPLARALAFAHRQGIVHRDVKPSNILLSADGRTPKLLDFGVARVEDARGDAAERTQVGQMIGTPRYMSPEQALGLPVDARADLFSLGVVLYEMVTGQVAFSATGIGTLAIQIAQEQPPAIERVVRDCPKGLRFIVERLLAKKPEQRFADGDALAAAMERELAALTLDERPTRRRGLALRFKLPALLATATAVALTGSVLVVLDRERTVLERMAVTSGSSITAFVTGNAAALAADNAGLAPEQQDWAPLQAFVDTAARDEGLSALVIADAGGTVRAASDHALIGRRYPTPQDRAIVRMGRDETVTDAGSAGFRFRRPIRYAGAEFGSVDVLVRRAAPDAAIGTADTLMLVLALFVMAVVALIGFLSAALISKPLKRLRNALDDVAGGDLAFRISHRRSDEVGALFDAFNRAVDAIEPRVAGVDPGQAHRALSETLVVSAPAPSPSTAAPAIVRAAA